MPQVKPEVETFAKINVVGVGGSGGSAVDRMVKAGIRGVDFMVMNTDVQALHHNSAPYKLHIGKTITRGLGAGMNPEVGRKAAEESINEIKDMLKGSDMVFITCGLGGGTGSGASPVIAQIAKELGALTVAIVTKPFFFEGPKRIAIANEAHRELSQYVDTIITIPNDKVLQIIDKKTSMLESFKIIDDVLHQGIQGISELITVPGLINLDFADVKTIMQGTGSALMGIGTASGENRAVEAAQKAIQSPLLELSIDGAQGILFTITGNSTLGMQEAAEAAQIITNSADPNAQVIFGAVLDDAMGDEIRISVVATGFDQAKSAAKVVVEEEIAVPVQEEKKEPALRMPFGPKKSMFTPPEEYADLDEKEEYEDEDDDFDDEDDFTFATKRVGSPMQMQEPEEEEEEPSFTKRVFGSKPALDPDLQERPVRSSMPAPTPKAPAQKSEDDLEIPTFIRKKMGM